MEYPYDSTFHPSAPVVRLRVGAPGDRPMEELDALLDSGADISAIPMELVRRLDLRRVDLIQVQGFGAEPREIPVFSAFMALRGEGERWIARVIPWAEGYALLGRNVLNRWRLVLDGPALMTTTG